jgi:hypothetical protein
MHIAAENRQATICQNKHLQSRSMTLARTGSLGENKANL